MFEVINISFLQVDKETFTLLKSEYFFHPKQIFE